jgi:2-deoxy-D-gluconate 3-dehydrogenase
MEDRDPFSVEGQHVLVTGGARGIGFGIAERFASRGATVLIGDLDGEAATSAATKLAGLAGRVEAMALDVTRDDAGPVAVSECVRRFGRLDVLVNNAGIFPSSPVLEMSRELFDRVLAVNLRGAVFLAKEAGRQMVEQGSGGAIVNIASIDALHPSMVGLGAYDASKGGLVMFTKSLALELAPHGIRVNAIAPGGIATEGTSMPLEGSGMTAEQMAAMMAEFVQRIPLGRIGTPDDIATVTVFLASSAAAYMTGELLVVDGGRLLS